MEERLRDSDDSDTDYSDEDTYDDEYNYYRDEEEESDVEELVRSDDDRADEMFAYPADLSGDFPSALYNRGGAVRGPHLRRDPPSEEDAPYCEREPTSRHPLRGSSLLSSRPEPPVLYAPERGPPLLDFLFVLTAFMAALFAAYYSMFSEMT